MRPEDTSLLGVLMDCFEKNETWDGWFLRQLPLRDAPTAARKYREFRDDLIRWKGQPVAEEAGEAWRRSDWGDIRMTQAGRGVLIWARSDGVADWWHEPGRREGDPMAEAWRWEAGAQPAAD